MVAPNPIPNATVDSTTADPADFRTEAKTRDLHVKGVPESIWRRARCNATNSGMSFKDYMIGLLATSQPLPNKPPC